MKNRFHSTPKLTCAAALFCAFSPAIAFLPNTVSAWTVDTSAQIVTLTENETMNYADLPAEYAAYTLNLAEGASVTHTAWIFNPLTGTGSFILAPTAQYDNPQKAMNNLTGFSGTVVLGPNQNLRLRGSGYSTFSENMTLDISGGAQLWLNEDLKSDVYLHDVGNAYDGLGQIRFDANGKTISGDISLSGNTTICARLDKQTSTNTISGNITGVHTVDDTVKDNLIFNGFQAAENTHATIVLTGTNSWNGTTDITHLNVELAENGTLGTGKITLSEKVVDGNITRDAGQLTINKTTEFTISNEIVSKGGILTNKGTGTTIFSGSLTNFVGTINADAGTIQMPAASSNKAQGIILKGSGHVYLTNPSSSSEFNLHNYDFSEFEGVLELQQGRTRQTNADYFGEKATVKINPGASLMFYDSNYFADFKSKLLLSGLGHAENRGAIRFHGTLSAEAQALLNTAGDVALTNVTGDVELFGNTFINSRAGDKIGWGAISGDISGDYTLTLNDNVGHGWILLTGTNSWKDTVIDGGTVQLGYAGSINGTAYDGTTGTLGTGTTTVKSGAKLDYRRVNAYTYAGALTNEGTILVNDGEFNVSGALTNSGTIHVAQEAVFTKSNNGNLGGKFTGDGTVTYAYSGGQSNTISADFSGFTGTVLLKAAPGSANRVMLSGRTVNFGENATLRIDDQGQLYLSNSSVYGNLEFGSSVGYKDDAGYQAALRSDGASNSYVYGTVKLLDDGAAISTRVNNNGNVENGSKMTLYADVTGPGSLTKHEDSEGNAGVLSFGKIEKDGKTYGGTVAYEGTTAVKSGVLRVLDGVTMHVQDDVTLGTEELKGTFDLEKGATLSIGAPDAKTGSIIQFTGSGELFLGGTLAFDVFSADDFDQLIIDAGILNKTEVPESIDILLADGADLGGQTIQLTEGFSTDFWEGVPFHLSTGLTAFLTADGNLAVGSSGNVPEPAAWSMLLLGVFGMFGFRKVRRSRKTA